MRPRITIVVLTFNGERYVDTCFGSLARADFDGLDVSIVAVDNDSSDGTVARIRSRYPTVTVIETGANLGFAGGNNVGMERALAADAEYVYLLNPDAEVTPGFLKEALAVIEARPGAGSVQSLLLLSENRDRINTAGNRIQFLGFGYCGQYRDEVEHAPTEPAEIAFASGASSLFRADALRQVGLLDEELFLYQEDMDLGWRLRLAGWDNVVAPRSIVFHDYEFSRSPAKFYFMERNRYLVLLKNSSARTLLVLSPVLFAAELGLLWIAASSGWLRQKLRADAQLLRPALWRHVARERRRISSIRRRSDAEVMSLHVADLSFTDLRSRFLDVIANPLLRHAWRVVRPWL